MRDRPALPKTLNREEAAARVREVLADSAHIVWKSHVYDRMEERGVTDMQVLQVLERGLVTADPQWTADRNWKFTMEADTAGEIVRVAVAIDVDSMGFFVIIITVMV